MNDITTKIRGYNKRKPNTDKKFKFSNDLIERSIYVGKGKEPDKRFDIATEGLSLWISPQGIKTFYAFKKIKMFNKRKLKFETNNSYKKIFRFEDSNHRNLAAAKDELHNTLKELSAPKLEKNEDITFGSLARDFIKVGMSDYRVADKGEKMEYKDSTKRKYIKALNSYILLKGGKDIVSRMVAPLIFKQKLYKTPFKDLALRDCTVSEVEVLQQRLKETKTLANDVLRVISVVFTWANDNDKFKGTNPVLSVSKFPSNKIRVKLTDLEVKQLMDHCEGKAFDYDPKFCGLVVLSLRIGKRCVELFGLRWTPPTTEKDKKECSGWLEENWRESGSYIYLHDTKNRKDERVYLDPTTRTLLMRLDRSRFTEANKFFVRSPFLFPQKRNINRHISDSSIAKKIAKLNKKFDWTYEYEGKTRNKFTIKIARKTFGSKVAEKEGLEIASRKLNHSNTKVTADHYVVPEDSQLELDNIWEDNIERFEKFKKVK